jgi:energy-coupling factor transporter ATP-binding protein EcfA2
VTVPLYAKFRARQHNFPQAKFLHLDQQHLITLPHMEYFKNLAALLKVEQREDFKLYQNLTASTTVAERRNNGLSWYPVAIRGTEIGRGDYLTVEIERTTHQELTHQFRSGSSVRLFSNHAAAADNIEGTVSFVAGNLMKISLRTDDLPDWSRDGKLGADLLFDNNTYNEMEQAIKVADSCSGSSHIAAKLVDILTGKRRPGFNAPIDEYPVPTLNEAQQDAVNKILSANELAIVHGPPGTGKTTTLVQAIKALLHQNNKQVLVVAPSNTAVDLLTEKLDEEGLRVVRIGNPARVSPKMLSHTLDSKMSIHERMKSVRTLKKQAAEFKNMAHKYKRNFGRAEQEQRKALFNEARKIMKEVDDTEQYIMDQIVSGSQVITATLAGANHYTIRELEFSTVVIDEAAQALEPACWIPILKAKKVVFAGDHCQLPPTIKSVEAAKDGLSTTLFEKCVSMYPEAVILLEEQYRMHKLIMGYSSEVFYNNQLKAHGTVADKVLFPGDLPLQFVDTAGCAFEEKTEGTSLSNPEEAAFLMGHLNHYLEKLSTRYSADNFPSIGIISPYQLQIRVLKELLPAYPMLSALAAHITINTIDSFQGQERDIVCLSLVRSNDERSIGFLADIRRMNVAMTRAKRKLMVVGDGATLSRLPFYSELITYAAGHEAYHSAWEFMHDL